MNVYLFQPQFPVYLKNEINYWLPYSAGCLWSYVNQFELIKNNFTLKQIFFKRESNDKILNSIIEPTIIGFSCYTWNKNYSINIARIIKNRWPNCLVVFGGPEASGNLLKYTFIDTIVMGEGEEAFVEILISLIENRPIPKFYDKKRLESLDIPSPYLEGVFDKIIDENPTIKWAATIETNRGCPYACTFCDWGSVTYSKVKKFNLERIAAELDWIKQNNIVFLFGADANFGIFRERDLEIAKLIRKAADESIGPIEAVNLQYAKNNIGSVFDIGKVLGPYNRGITVSVQSMNKDTLSAIKRTNLEVNDIQKMMNLSIEHNVNTYTEVILGLPLETEQSWKDGITGLLELGQHQSIDISFTELLENSELNTFNNRIKYGIKSIKVEQYSEIDDMYPEEIEIITSTNTLTTDQLLDCYMYSWMIINVHITGYTQVYSKYARYFNNISYRKFYDILFEKLILNSILKDHFNEFRNNVESYLKFGKFSNSKTNQYSKFGALYFESHKFLYENKGILYELGREVLEYFSIVVPKSLIELQNNFIWDQNQKFPIIISSAFNIEDLKYESVIYTIDSKINDESFQSIDFYAIRYKNLLKNIILTTLQN